MALVADPKRGLATKCKFLPTIAELTEALEYEMEPYRKAWREKHEQRTLPRPAALKRTPEEIARVQEMAKNLFKEPDDSTPTPQRAQA